MAVVTGEMWQLNPENSCSFGGVSLNSVQDISISRTADTTNNTSDGIKTVQGTFVDNIVYTVTITTNNPAQSYDNTWDPGICGTLIINGVQKDCGKGLDTDTLTLTCDEATIISLDESIPHSGQSGGNLTLQCTSSDGTDIFAVS